MATTNAPPSDDERQIKRLRSLLLEGALSPQSPPTDSAYFERLRERVRQRSAR